MNLSLKPESESFIQQQIVTGNYANASEVIEAALNLLDRQQSYAQWQQEIGDKVDIAVAQIEQGEGLNGDEVFAGLRAKFQAARQDRVS
jgi:antitoxin ParD1/3/4